MEHIDSYKVNRSHIDFQQNYEMVNFLLAFSHFSLFV